MCIGVLCRGVRFWSRSSCASWSRGSSRGSLALSRAARSSFQLRRAAVSWRDATQLLRVAERVRPQCERDGPTTVSSKLCAAARTERRTAGQRATDICCADGQLQSNASSYSTQLLRSRGPHEKCRCPAAAEGSTDTAADAATTRRTTTNPTHTIRAQAHRNSEHRGMGDATRRRSTGQRVTPCALCVLRHRQLCCPRHVRGAEEIGVGAATHLTGCVLLSLRAFRPLQIHDLAAGVEFVPLTYRSHSHTESLPPTQTRSACSRTQTRATRCVGRAPGARRCSAYCAPSHG